VALYEVVLRSLYFGQAIINRFHYSVADGIGVTPSAEELLDRMGFIPTGDPPAVPADTVFEALIAATSNSVQYLEAEARELYSVTDFFVAPYSTPFVGDLTGQAMSPTAAWGFRTNRVRTDIRRGFKRFVGVTEDYVGSGGDVTGAVSLILTPLAEKMSAGLSGATASYIPAVFQFEEYTTPSGRKAYKKYADPAVQAAHVASGVTFAPYTTVRTQVSRQYGRGV